jgi:Flp pilus assembly protein TadG
MKRDGGSASAELVFVVPVLILIGLVAVALGRLVLGEGQLVEAARSAAESASLWPTPAEAQAAAAGAAHYEILHNSLACNGAQVDIGSSDFVPGGRLVVTVTCPASVVPAIPGVPDELTLSATATAPIEPFREVG